VRADEDSFKLPSFAERVPWISIDARVEALCRSLMTRAAADRPADAEAVLATIDELLADLRDSPPPRAARGSGEHAPAHAAANLALATEPTLEVHAIRTRW
jgi:hypothetical protein